MEDFVLIDFETRSACDLKKAGACVYAYHPLSEVICLGYSLSGNAPGLWRPGDPIPPEVARAAAAGTVFVAHNVAFERYIWEAIMVARFGWPRLRDDQWFDTVAACAYRALPLKLADACRVLRLPAQKGTTPSKYFKPTKSGAFLEPGPEVFDYCKDDVSAEIGLVRRLKGLPRPELNIWRLNQTMNMRGVGIDLAYVAACQEIVDQASIPLAREFAELTGGLGCSQRDKVIAWIRSQGVNLPDMRKETIDELLAEPSDDDEDGEDSLAGDITEAELRERVVLPEGVRRALTIRKSLASTSIKKLASMRACTAYDGRAHGLIQYHGAGTGRDAGRLLQPQNFPRGEVKLAPDHLVAAIMSRDFQLVELITGVPAITAVSSGLRHAIHAAPGKLLCVGDFSTVEARIVLALAGQTDKVEYLRQKGPIYELMAEQIFGVPAMEIKAGAKGDPPDPIMMDMRQTGKNSVLGLGFQMGWRKFKLKYAKEKPDEFCQRVVKVYREEFAPEVPKLWWGLERAALNTVKTGRPHEHAGIVYRLHDGFLKARLPSGRELHYFKPELVRRAVPWDPEDLRLSWTYWAKKAKGWVRVDAYGGLLTENVVQAIARDLLYHSALRCEQENLPMILTVHDENVTEPEERLANADVLREIMCDIPEWAREIGIPIDAECWIGPRYKK